jgi:monofunctional biosynthetic peptidoglycan transglycosylase
LQTLVKKKRGVLRSVLLLIGGALLFVHICALIVLVALRWIDPPTTAVQAERRVSAWILHKPYHKRYTFVPLRRISPNLQHAVVAAEDGRFYRHHGIDWHEVQTVVDEDLDKGKLGRGGSTITQQLVKNLFLSTNRSLLWKALEFTLAPAAELVLPKRRILELYLNVIEWGPGIYGAEAAANSWYHVPAAKLSRDEAARLAALVPSPLRRRPDRVNWYSTQIERRMEEAGW